MSFFEKNSFTVKFGVDLEDRKIYNRLAERFGYESEAYSASDLMLKIAEVAEKKVTNTEDLKIKTDEIAELNKIVNEKEIVSDKLKQTIHSMENEHTNDLAILQEQIKNLTFQLQQTEQTVANRVVLGDNQFIISLEPHEKKYIDLFFNNKDALSVYKEFSKKYPKVVQKLENSSFGEKLKQLLLNMMKYNDLFSGKIHGQIVEKQNLIDVFTKHAK